MILKEAEKKNETLAPMAMRSILRRCRYWHEEHRDWMSDGCKVGQPCNNDDSNNNNNNNNNNNDNNNDDNNNDDSNNNNNNDGNYNNNTIDKRNNNNNYYYNDDSDNNHNFTLNLRFPQTPPSGLR